MNVLRDYVCTGCDTVVEDRYVDINDVSRIAPCSTCGKETLWVSLCNGGCKSRWRYCDFSDDPTNYFGQTSHKVEVIDEDTGENVKLLDSDENVHDLPKFTDPDIQGEKRDRAEHSVKQERGKNPIYIG